MIDLKKIWIFILSLVCLVLFSTLFNKCEEEKIQVKNVNALNSELKSYKLQNGKLAWSVESLGYTKEQLQKNILEKDSKIKELASKLSKVKSVTKYITNTVIDSIPIHYKDTVPCVYERIGLVSEKDFSLKYKSTQKGISITNLSIPDSVIVVTGQKRKWFLGKETSVLDMTHSNKHVQTKKIQHIEVTPRKRWYDTTLFKFATGVVVGAILIK